MKVTCSLLTISSVTESAILGASPRQRFFSSWNQKMATSDAADAKHENLVLPE